MTPSSSSGGDLILKLLDLAPVVTVLIIYILRLESRHKDLLDRYATLQARYIRDIRAIAKLPADEFADDLDAPHKLSD